MPRGVQSRDASVQDCLIAEGALGREQLVVVVFAIGFAVAFEEVLSAELLAAVFAEEVLAVPGLAQRRDHLTHDGLLTGRAIAFSKTGHSIL